MPRNRRFEGADEDQEIRPLLRRSTIEAGCSPNRQRPSVPLSPRNRQQQAQHGERGHQLAPPAPGIVPAVEQSDPLADGPGTEKHAEQRGLVWQARSTRSTGRGRTTRLASVACAQARIRGRARRRRSAEADIPGEHAGGPGTEQGQQRRPGEEPLVANGRQRRMDRPVAAVDDDQFDPAPAKSARAFATLFRGAGFALQDVGPCGKNLADAPLPPFVAAAARVAQHPHPQTLPAAIASPARTTAHPEKGQASPPLSNRRAPEKPALEHGEFIGSRDRHRGTRSAAARTVPWIRSPMIRRRTRNTLDSAVHRATSSRPTSGRPKQRHDGQQQQVGIASAGNQPESRNRPAASRRSPRIPGIA